MAKEYCFLDNWVNTLTNEKSKSNEAGSMTQSSVYFLNFMNLSLVIIATSQYISLLLLLKGLSPFCFP